MIKLPSVLIHPRPIRRRNPIAVGFGWFFAPAVMWLLLSVLLRVMAS